MNNMTKLLVALAMVKHGVAAPRPLVMIELRHPKPL